MEWTSHDVVAAVRRRLGIKRVGHTGTLDPMATGVLPVAFGKSTRMIEYYEADLKTYRAEMQLGIVTDTLDVTGTVLSEQDYAGVTEEAVRSVLEGMVGFSEQIPPKYSAVRVNGRHLYDYARKGIDVAIKPRQIYIDDIYDIEMDLTKGTVSFSVDCAKGTYIRSICDDAGRALGPGAAMSSLVRTASGLFTLSGAVTIEELLDLSDEALEERIIPVEDTLNTLGEITLREERWEQFFLNGREILPEGYEVSRVPFIPVWLDPDAPIGSVYKVQNMSGEFLGTGTITEENNMLKADKVIAERTV